MRGLAMSAHRALRPVPRLAGLKVLNSMLVRLLPLFNLPGVKYGSPVGELITDLRGLLFYDSKIDLWNRALQESHVDKEMCTVYLNRHARIAQPDIRAFCVLRGPASSCCRATDLKQRVRPDFR